MATLLRIDTATLPRVLVLDPPVTDAEFEALCRENREIRLERTKEGAVRMNPPTGGWTGSGNMEISTQLNNWWSMHERGMVFDSSTAFRLPDGSTLSPDASYVSAERLRALPKDALRGFPPVCPDFVIELRSESDPIRELKSKMEDWIANGAQLAWLIDPWRREAYIYRPNATAEAVNGNQVAGEGPIQGFVLDLARVWKRYE
ncbi:MAG TPA: Uma2 family endonuclease [Terracidiphilus sp.]|nr:Uma2 family endonuclease [Terracidiphilus sp.]